jgi:arylsulfatase A-like enzyme
MYCGDNGTSADAGRTGITLREQKGSMYEGGILVPGVAGMAMLQLKEPASTSVLSFTSDILPTLAEITSQQLPDRPIDGVSLVPFFNNPAKQRTKPIYFWQFKAGKVFDENPEPYIDHELQEGTTPLAKIGAGKFTRNFRNYKYTQDFRK